MRADLEGAHPLDEDIVPPHLDDVEHLGVEAQLDPLLRDAWPALVAGAEEAEVSGPTLPARLDPEPDDRASTWDQENRRVPP